MFSRTPAWKWLLWCIVLQQTAIWIFTVKRTSASHCYGHSRKEALRKTDGRRVTLPLVGQTFSKPRQAFHWYSDETFRVSRPLAQSQGPAGLSPKDRNVISATELGPSSAGGGGIKPSAHFLIAHLAEQLASLFIRGCEQTRMYGTPNVRMVTA
jgi:hypothetical protein